MFRTCSNFYAEKVTSLFENDNVENFNCKICEFAKHHRVSFPLKTPKLLSQFSSIDSDVWHPCVNNTSSSRQFVTLIYDCCTRTTWVLYLVKSKFEVSTIFPTFHKFISTQFGAKIHTLRSNDGKEYFNEDLITYL